GGGLERLDVPVAKPGEGGALRGRDWIAAGSFERGSWVALHAVDQDFEMKVWAGAQPRATDVRHRLTDRDVRADAHFARESAQVAVARHVAVPMPNLEHVAV